MRKQLIISGSVVLDLTDYLKCVCVGKEARKSSRAIGRGNIYKKV